jgi:probable DNA metabolism protein
MKAWLYDDSFDGLLTTIALQHESGERPESITPATQAQMNLFGTTAQVSTDPVRAERLLRSLREKVSPGVARVVTYVGLSELPDLEMPLFDFIELAFRHGEGVLSYHANGAVRCISDVARRVGGEIHRLKGLLRFRDTEQGILWGPLEPDHNVIVPISFHFRKRMPRERWMIHDVRRGLAVLWDGSNLEEREDKAIPAVKLSDDEGEVQGLWRAFYDKVAITERSNPRLQRQNMPRRYWKYLVEKGTG